MATEHKPSEFSSKLSFYQSANNDNKSIKDNFIIRLSEYQQIINALKTKKAKDPLQHELILGRRGSGKSTLLKRIQIEIDENETLANKYIAINFAEEQSSIYRLSDLWFEVINELQDRFLFNSELIDFKTFKSDDQYTRYLYDVIHNYLNTKKKKLVLLLDNFDRIIENFTDEGNLLREILINYNDVQIIGGSTRMSEHFWQYDQPFYEFFRQHRLESLSTKEMMKLILHWSDTLDIEELRFFVKNNKGKIEAIRILTDGLPRTLQFFIEILLDNSYLYGYEYLKKIMDKVTPVYQERLNTLPAQLRKIITEMAFIWTACTTKQLVEQCRMPSKLISANLKTLIDKGIVTKIETDKKNHLYRISERFFNMWFIITQGNPVQKRKAKWLSIFLECWYNQEDFKKITSDHIKNLSDNKIPYDKALLLSKALSQSKYTSTEQRDQIIDLVESLNKTNKDSLIQLPKRYKEIAHEIKVLVEAEKYDEAITKANGIENEEGGVKFLIIGYINMRREEHVKAEEYYLLSIAKGNINAIKNLGNLFNNQDKLEKAEEYYLLAIEKGDISAINSLAIFYDNQDKLEKAEEYYLLAIEKGNISAINNLGILYDNQDKLEKAEEYYLLALEKGDINAINNLATLYQDQDKLEKAEEYYLLAIEKGHVNAINNLAILYKDQDKLEKAEEYYLLAIEKGHVNAITMLANLYIDQDKLEKAEEYYLLAIKKGDNNAINNLAILYKDQDKLEKAEEYFLSAIEKGHVNAITMLANLYIDQDKLEKAEEYYLLAIEKGDINGIKNLAAIFYSENSNKEEALKRIKQYNKQEEQQLFFLFEILIEVWNGIFNNVEKRINQLIQKHGMELLEEVLIEFLVHKQKNVIFNLFENPEFGGELKERYTIINFVVSQLVKPENKEIKLSIPPEIKETVDSVMNYVEERQVFYGYKK